MKILIAEDDPVSRRVLEGMLGKWGYELEVATDGIEAWEGLHREDAPRLAILDWMMPGIDGLEVCRRVRASAETEGAYLILVTARGEKSDIVEGLEAGANDYITKPFDRDELRARLRVGERVLDLQENLAQRVRELQEALALVKQLQGIVPICMYCKKVRTDEQYWQRVEDYISAHAAVDFSHGICPECWEKVVQPEMEEMWGHSIPYEEATGEAGTA